MHQRSEQDERLAALMRSAQDGDRSAYAALLSEVAALARQIVRRRFAFLQPQEVEDLVQDVLLSVHAARSTYDPERPFLPWLAALARNRIADGARRYARRTANEVVSERLPETFRPSKRICPKTGMATRRPSLRPWRTCRPGSGRRSSSSSCARCR
jgi:DNA-directed RNA polymerase specialized sigma24 family protein